MNWAEVKPENEKIIYSGLQESVKATRQQADEAEQDLQMFIRYRAHRCCVGRPWEICGAEDSWHPRHPEGHPDYDEDDLVPHVQCQLPKGHESRWHQEWSEDGKLLGEWSG